MNGAWLPMAPAAAPLLAIAGAVLAASLPAARPDGVIATIPVLAAGLVVALAASGTTPTASCLDDPLAIGAAALLVLLGFSASLAVAGYSAVATRPTLTGTNYGSTGRRLRLVRAVPGLLTGLAIFAVRSADPSLALLAITGVAIVAGAAGGLARGVDAARAALDRVLLGVAAAAAALIGLLLAGAASPVTGAPLAFGGRLLALAGLVALAVGGPSAMTGGARPRAGEVTALAPILMLAPSLAAFPLLLRVHAAIGGGALALADAVLLALGLIGIALAAARAGRIGPAFVAGRTFLAVALLATGLGGTTGAAAALLALCAAVGAVPALAFPFGAGRWSGRLAAAAAAGLPPAGGYAALALAGEDAASRSMLLLPVLFLVLAPAALAVLRAQPTDPVPWPARLAGGLHLLGLLGLGLVPLRTVADGLAAAAELLGRHA